MTQIGTDEFGSVAISLSAEAPAKAGYIAEATPPCCHSEPSEESLLAGQPSKLKIEIPRSARNDMLGKPEICVYPPALRSPEHVESAKEGAIRGKNSKKIAPRALS